MPQSTVRVEAIGKRYRIGAAAVRHDTLRDAIAHAVRAPLRNFQRLRRMSRFTESEASDVVWALSDVSFEVERGEVLGVIGRNGAGKSTLLKILSRVTDPTTGFAELHGRVGALLEVGTGFHPELTGRENVYLNGSILGMDRGCIDRRFEQIVEFSGVGRFLDTPVKRYSSGMRLRLAFAVAAHLDPEILIVDEVLAVGDVEFQRKCLGRMDEVVCEGRTILFVSHNMAAVQRLCSRCILLESGRITREGPAADVVTHFLAGVAVEVAPIEWFDLSQASRTGTGGARISGVAYSSLAPNVAFRPYPHGPLEIRLAISAGARQRIAGVAVWIADRHGTKLVVGHAGSVDRLLVLEEGRTELRTRIRQLHLNPGAYVTGLCLVDRHGETLDCIESAFQLEVVGTRSRAFGRRGLRDGVVPCELELVEAAGESDPAAL